MASPPGDVPRQPCPNCAKDPQRGFIEKCAGVSWRLPCALCGDAVFVPTGTAFVQAVRLAARNPSLDANQCLAYIYERLVK